MHKTQTRTFIKHSLWELSEHVTAETIKVKDLAMFSGISRTVFYRNFGCLSDVWHSIGHDVLSDIATSQENFNAINTHGLRENVLQNVATSIFQEKDKIQIITADCGDPIFIPKFEKQIQLWILKCICNSGHWEEDLQQRQMAAFLTRGLVHSTLDGIKENNWDKISQSFLSLDQVFYALHLKKEFYNLGSKEYFS